MSDSEVFQLHALMHPNSKALLAEHLQHMLEHGANRQLLFMRVKATADGMLAGAAGGELELHYPCAQIRDFALSGRFLAFCRRHSLDVIKERWGKHLVYRASIGSHTANAAGLIAQCFQEVYGHSGRFALDLRGYGWEPSAGAFEARSALIA